MKANLSKDGINRATVTIQTRLSIDDISTYWIAEKMHYTSYDWSVEQTVEWFRMITKQASHREIVNAVKDCILMHGVETPHYRVGDGLYNSSNEVKIAIEPILREKIKGF